MTPFDPAINYGPNDAGASAFSIITVFIAIILISWLLGAGYGFISTFLNKKKDLEDHSNQK